MIVPRKGEISVILKTKNRLPSYLAMKLEDIETKQGGSYSHHVITSTLIPYTPQRLRVNVMKGMALIFSKEQTCLHFATHIIQDREKD